MKQKNGPATGGGLPQLAHRACPDCGGVHYGSLSCPFKCERCGINTEPCDKQGCPRNERWAQQAAAVQPRGFTPSELKLDFIAWKEVSEPRRAQLAAEVREWLGAWKQWDLACSPMDDNERRLLRYGHYLGWAQKSRHGSTGIAGVPSGDAPSPLRVWFGSMAESNGKANWTATLHRGDLTEGFTFAHSEYKDRVRYEADCMRYLIGELDKRPDLFDYDGNLIEHADDARYTEWEKADAVARGVPSGDGGQR